MAVEKRSERGEIEACTVVFQQPDDGEGLTDLYDPNVTDPLAPEEIVDHIREGQEWLKSLV